MCASLKMACLDSIYYELRSNSAWLIALGTCLQIEDASHETAFWFTRRYRGSQPTAFSLPHSLHYAFDLIHKLYDK